MTSRAPAGRWYSSFYWRIGVSFVVFVVVVLVGQGLMVGYARTRGAFAPGNPNGAATAMAARLGDALAVQPDLDTSRYLHDNFAPMRQPAFVVLRDGRTASTSEQRLRPAILRQAQAALAGRAPESADDDAPTGPVVMAPVQVGGRLAGLVILPPPPPRGMLANVGELLTLPGTLGLVFVSAIAALVIFAPARNRLRALEAAAQRLGAGELETRAPVTGRDEVTRVAAAFNQMAGDLQARTEALRTSDRLRRQMLADISHELRTPLTTMRGYLETLDMPEIVVDAERRRRYLETARRETLRLDRLVNDLLELARFENAVAAIEPRVVAVERIFAGIVRRFEHDAGAAGVRLRSQVDPSADQIFADPNRLDQAISNLVANALRHTPPGGRIDLEASTGTDGCRLSVVDSGVGIAPEHLPHVFDRFYKVDRSRTADSKGSGLGLSIAKAIVERHGGTMTVTSRPGRTCFEMTLPDAVET